MYVASVDKGVEMIKFDFTPKVTTVRTYAYKHRPLLIPKLCLIKQLRKLCNVVAEESMTKQICPITQKYRL